MIASSGHRARLEARTVGSRQKGERGVRQVGAVAHAQRAQTRTDRAADGCDQRVIHLGSRARDERVQRRDSNKRNAQTRRNKPRLVEAAMNETFVS